MGNTRQSVQRIGPGRAAFADRFAEAFGEAFGDAFGAAELAESVGVLERLSKVLDQISTPARQA